MSIEQSSFVNFKYKMSKFSCDATVLLRWSLQYGRRWLQLPNNRCSIQSYFSESVTAIQIYLFQYKYIYSRTNIFIPVQMYLFHYKCIYSSTNIFIPVQIYLFQYKYIFSQYKRKDRSDNLNGDKTLGTRLAQRA